MKELIQKPSKKSWFLLNSLKNVQSLLLDKTSVKGEDRRVKQILLVEDNLQLQSLYATALLRVPYGVAIAGTHDQAQEILSNLTPDLILLDIMLPGGKTGLDLLEFIRSKERLRKVPVIVMTSLDNEKNIALELGASDYIVKTDISVPDFLQKVDRIFS